MRLSLGSDNSESSTENSTSNIQPTPMHNTGQANRPAQVDRKESYKAQRKSYAKEKKRVERELLSTFKDQSIIVLADWLKVRGTLKSWTKLWCVLKPGLLLLYRSQKAKSSHWVGTIILSTCELIERPSKKDGFCFKLFHPMDQSIWAARGPEGETLGAVVQPLPNSHLIFRAPNNAAGKCWMDALELALRCSSLLLRTMSSTNSGTMNLSLSSSGLNQADDGPSTPSSSMADPNSSGTVDLNETEVEKRHFLVDIESVSDEDLLDDNEDEEEKCNDSDFSEDTPFRDNQSETSNHSTDQSGTSGCSAVPAGISAMTKYVPDPSGEVFGTANDQTQEISDENKSIIWFLIKQVRPGMDLSKVVLPTFILEPRSFLEKLSDYYYHADLLANAVREEEPFNRMKQVVKWYLSGFYKKPKGLKKPYNPILGETFRCYWEHPNGTKTFYIAEQVSHHPPISAFYVTNRQEGFTVSSTILAKSRFYGNSTSAILEGTATLTLLTRGEEYFMSMPYAHCKGILMGTMTVELGGKVSIECTKTGYSTEMEFKLRPFLGGGEFTNAVSGRIKLGKETIATIDGHWDELIQIKDKRRGVETLWEVTPEVREKRLKRYTVPLDEQGEFESANLWRRVSDAIESDDQQAATEEKSILEEAQRSAARDRKVTGFEWVPKFFEWDSDSESYVYLHSDLRPWDPLNDLQQYERDFIVCTRTMHKTPMIRTQSIVSVSDAVTVQPGSKLRHRRNTKEKLYKGSDKTQSKANDVDPTKQSLTSEMNSDHLTPRNTTGENGNSPAKSCANSAKQSFRKNDLCELLRPLEELQRTTNERLITLQQHLDILSQQQRERDANVNLNRDMVVLVVLVVMIQAVLNWVLTSRANAALGGDFHGSSPHMP